MASISQMSRGRSQGRRSIVESKITQTLESKRPQRRSILEHSVNTKLPSIEKSINGASTLSAKRNRSMIAGSAAIIKGKRQSIPANNSMMHGRRKVSALSPMKQKQNEMLKVAFNSVVQHKTVDDRNMDIGLPPYASQQYQTRNMGKYSQLPSLISDKNARI